MASTFAELYSDFQDRVKAYVEKLDITEYSFMRMLTQGIQKFQRETEYAEKVVKIQKEVNGNREVFIVPNDMIRPIDVRAMHETPYGVEEEIFLLQSYEQFIRNKDKWEMGYLETPTDYELRIPHKRTAPAVRARGHVRLATIYSRELLTFPEYKGNELVVWYIPDLYPISAGTEHWEPWYPLDVNFMRMFTTARITPSLAPFETSFVDYVLSVYIQSKGSANYRVYEEQFMAAIQRAIETKPTLFREAVADYMFAPFS